ncbi:FAD-dependent oxidoreductase [Pusillimonas sp. ANT_WB101]|uniref:FAD-dependent oxidoreductase n=1 Tax=Pusillimonas sp. ANT_WB101 TaxID=2597356 RepID=UPI0011EE2DBF|nr:FAD-dependent oxidoreductase [Pusillimonas sp. ANT_WB101]KAA0889947.1 FAD-dependent oxidoreductase [Pusillimonas sp. ANT_WB101]
MELPEKLLSCQCCVVGGGPAGMMLGLLLARAGIKTAVIEKHGDFLRDFRGDTVHPSTLQILDELGLKSRFDQLPQQRVSQLEVMLAHGPCAVADFRKLKPFPYLALVPQWDLLALLAQESARYPWYSLHMQSEAIRLVHDETSGRVCGVHAQTPNGTLHIRADLIVGCDGRQSMLRHAAGMHPQNLGAPMDVLWFKVPRATWHPKGTYGVPGRGSFLVLLNRGNYWQTAVVIPKGAAERWQAQPLQLFRDSITRRAPFLSNELNSLTSWDDVKLLEVRVDRLQHWHQPGLLFIGDAAHAMSPIGGVGINLAIQDAVAAANIIAAPLLAGLQPNELTLARVQRRRMLPTRLTQHIQTTLQRRLIAPALQMNESDGPIEIPALLKLLLRSDTVRSIPARIFGLGFRREHVRSPECKMP